MRSLTLSILRELSVDRFTSGADLAARFGVSRSAVSDAVKEASALGVKVFSLPRRGYRLAEPVELLDVAVVRRALGAGARRINLDVVDCIDSTNTALLQRAADGAPGGSMLAAEVQTAGRGRRGRSWQSTLGASLTFSLLWRFERGAALLGGLSLAVGIAVAETLRAEGIDAQVKWPNDILAEGRKLGGILIETQGDVLGPTAAVIGIGINMRVPDALRAAIDQPIAGVAEWNEAFSRNRLLAALIARLVETLDAFSRNGFAPLRDRFDSLHAFGGADIWIVEDATRQGGKVVGVSPEGGLIVEAGGRPRVLVSGEISLRARK